MSSTPIAPALGEPSFSCPSCGAIAHQTWYDLFIDAREKDKSPWMPAPEILQRIDRDFSSEASSSLKEYFKKRLAKKPFSEEIESNKWLNNQLENVYVSECYSCNQYSIWAADELIYPHQKYSVTPAAEMPDNIKSDFLEAASIVDASARGAAALLRLCIQKIVIALGGKGENLNEDIGKLVEQRSIPVSIQQALDVVRVVGNNAVHPGVIDFKDNKAIASKLFQLVNVIVETTIAGPKHVKNIYDSVVPESARKAIEKRDAPKLLPSGNETK
ncbi:MAG: DUF4145 domain-containing protein [Xanthobacteraceae bacterium]